MQKDKIEKLQRNEVEIERMRILDTGGTHGKIKEINDKRRAQQ